MTVLTDWRYADEFAGSDMGAKINAAIADLPSSGGVVWLPAGDYSISTPIEYGTRDNVLVAASGFSARAMLGSDGSAAPTILRSTITTAPVVTIGSSGGTATIGCGLWGVVIDQISTTAYPAVKIAKSVRGSIRDVAVQGRDASGYPAYLGTGIQVGDISNACDEWTLERCEVVAAGDGIKVVNSRRCEVAYCRTARCHSGIAVGDYCDDVVVLGGTCHDNRDAGLDVDGSDNVTVVGLRIEGRHESVGDGYGIRVGQSAQCRNITLMGCCWASDPAVLNVAAIRADNLDGMMVVGGEADSNWPTFLSLAGSGVGGVKAMGVLHDGTTFCDNEGGVEMIAGCGSNHWLLAPPTASTYIRFKNLPTSAPAVSGAIWNDGGTLKVV